MWNMMGCSGCRSDELNIIHDSHLKAENLGPAVVIQNPSSSTTASNNPHNPITCSIIRSPPPTNMSQLINHHHHHQDTDRVGVRRDQHGRMDLKDQLAAAPRSSRWTPTAEQLFALEELYRRGLKTPTAQQVRQITAMLLNFGKIEGKNVFYWFQNHRARERQKRRREMTSITSHSHSNKQQAPSNINHTLQSIQSAGSTRTCSVEVERKKWTPLSNCNSALPEESSSVQRSAAEMGTPSEERKEVQLQGKQITPITSCSPFSPYSNNTTKLPNSSPVTILDDTSNILQYYQNVHFGALLMTPNRNGEKSSSTTTTLELFPLHSDHHWSDITKEDIKYLPITRTMPDQFFHFL